MGPVFSVDNTTRTYQYNCYLSNHYILMPEKSSVIDYARLKPHGRQVLPKAPKITRCIGNKLDKFFDCRADQMSLATRWKLSPFIRSQPLLTSNGRWQCPNNAVESLLIFKNLEVNFN
jgi:hypothetical protein